MKILFLVYHGFSDESGISKKIHYQVKGMEQNGHEVHLCYYDFDTSGNRCRYVNGQVIHNYGKGKLAAIRSRLQLDCIYKYCTEHSIELMYVRSFMNASPVLVRLFKRIKSVGINSVMEIPTYPYDKEVSGYCLNDMVSLQIDKLFRKQLASQMASIVTFSDVDRIFGQRTIRISNGSDFDEIPLHQPKTANTSEIHLIGVAEIHYWHGFDRLVAGMGEYYMNNPNGKKIYFHVVGWEDTRGLFNNGYLTIDQVAKKYEIEKYVIKHGRLFGEQLDEIFNECVFAIGSLGRHRSGVYSIKTLKNREYAARGIPFIYSENDNDFDDKPYKLKASADEQPISVSAIVDFIDKCNIGALTIRQSVKHLSWKSQMKKVIDNIK